MLRKVDKYGDKFHFKNGYMFQFKKIVFFSVEFIDIFSLENLKKLWAFKLPNESCAFQVKYLNTYRFQKTRT